MMQIVYFSQKEQFLTHMESHTGKKIFVTPSPAKADGLRERLKAGAYTDVITVAKFTSNLIGPLWENAETPKIKRKAELLLIFGILKNKYLPDLGYEQFTQAYNLFSDLRSFSLDENALTSVLEEQPSEIRQAIQLFWKLLGITEYLDEHGAYQKVAEALRSAEEIDELNKTYIFWGFQHLNGQQVDLLKALSIRYEVIIPFPLALKSKLKKSDWVSWLKDSKTGETDLESLPESPACTWMPVNSRELALNLREIVKDHDQIVLGVSKLSPMHLDFVPSLSVSYKIPLQLVDAELKEIARDLKQEARKGLMVSTLHELLLGRNAPTLKHFKARQLYLEALQSILEMTDENLSIDSFFLKLLGEVVGLNQPRNSYVPVSSIPLTIDLKDMSSLEQLDRRRRTVLCVDERFEDIQGLGQNYTESIQKALSTLGPLKRNELELLFKQWEFRDLFSRSEVIVLMGKETLKHSLIWKRLFTGIAINTVDRARPVGEKRLNDHFTLIEKKTFEGNFSASKMQSFIDCPRKFYFSYVDKVFPDVQLEKDFDPMTSGTIIHEIIEKFFKLNLNDTDLRRLTAETMGHYIREKKLKLTKEIYVQNELIFNHRAFNGIQYLRNLEKAVGETISWELEREFELTGGHVIKGKIDCIGTGKDTLYLLDFKSTSSANGSEVESFESIQLWTYAFAAKSLKKDFAARKIVMGFILLDNPLKSRLFVDDKEFAKLVKDAGFSGTTHVFENPYPEVLRAAEETMNALTISIRQEMDFPAKPRDPQKCIFCDLNKLCVKSELIHGQDT